MNENPLFSLIVPVYNVEDYLADCMVSLLAQSPVRGSESNPAACGKAGEGSAEQGGFGYEIILVDDGSTDGSGALCDRFAADYPELVRVIHQENGGLGAARNTGIDFARGEYLFFIDSDDTVDRQSLALLAGEIEKTRADMYVFSYKYIRDNGEASGDPRKTRVDGVARTLSEEPALLIDTPSACFRVCRKALFEGIRFPSGVWYEDLRTTPKLLLAANSIVQLDAELYFYRIREGSIMHDPRPERNREIIPALEDVREYFEDKAALEDVREYFDAKASSENVSEYSDAKAAAVVTGADFASEAQSAANFYGLYMEYLATVNCMDAARRVLIIDPEAEYLPDFMDYVAKSYPEYGNNPQVRGMGFKKRVFLRLLEKKRYNLCRRLFLR